MPTVLKVLRGNPGKRRLNRHEPEPGVLAVTVPGEIARNADARREWGRTMVPAIQSGQIAAADRVFAIAHCELWATWRAQLAIAAKQPHIVEAGATKYPTPNPARQMANRTFQMLAKVDAELGFTPTSRARVTMARRLEEDPAASFFDAPPRRVPS